MKLKHKLFAIACGLLSTGISAGEPSVYRYKLGRKLPQGEKIQGEVNVQLKYKKDIYGKKITTTKDFYGIDLHGFSSLPAEVYVRPLEAAHFRWGGNLHSVYNWKLNSYYDEYESNFYYVYAKVDRRVKQIKNKYKANPLVQVNLMGWQPTQEGDLLVLKKSANAAWAKQQLLFLNLEKNVGLVDIVVGNEPFLWSESHDEVWQGDRPSADEYIKRFVSYVLELRSAQEEISGDANDINIWGPEMATSWVDWQTMNPKDCKINHDSPAKFDCLYGNGKFTHFLPYFLSRIAEIEKDSSINPKSYKLLDYLSFHYYPLFRSDFDDDGSIILDKEGRINIAGMLESTNIWNNPTYVNKYDTSSPKGVVTNLINKYKAWRDSYYPTAKLAVTEYGVDSKASISYPKPVRSIYLADLMARVKEAGLDVFVKSFLKNGNDGSSNEWSLIGPHGKKTDLYNVYQLFSNNYLGKSLEVSDNFDDTVNGYGVFYEAERRGRKKNYIHIFLVNKSPESKNISLNLKKASTGLNQKALEVELGGWSVTFIKIPNNKTEKVIVKQFGAKEMRADVSDYLAK